MEEILYSFVGKSCFVCSFFCEFRKNLMVGSVILHRTN